MERDTGWEEGEEDMIKIPISTFPDKVFISIIYAQ
jgi:hypothetical protein